MSGAVAPPVTAFLARAAGEFRRGGYVFTGFGWPVLAARLASRLGGDFVQVYEAGATCHGAGATVPTSTTDYPAFADVLGFQGTAADVLLTMVRRCDRVVLDAANVDVAGRVNATAVGRYARPRVRLPGGGGAADAATAARELVLLFGGADPTRLRRRVEHVTAAPAEGTPVRLHTRWGVLRLGRRPMLAEFHGPAPEAVVIDHLRQLGVDTTGAVAASPVPPADLTAAREVLAEAAARGHRAAAAALAQEGGGDG